MESVVLLAIGLMAWVDCAIIAFILLLNAFVGFVQEKRAADVVAALKGDIAMKATVIRCSVEQQILARELVPGDIVSHHHNPLAPLLQRSWCYKVGTPALTGRCV